MSETNETMSTVEGHATSVAKAKRWGRATIALFVALVLVASFIIWRLREDASKLHAHDNEIDVALDSGRVAIRQIAEEINRAKGADCQESNDRNAAIKLSWHKFIDVIGPQAAADPRAQAFFVELDREFPVVPCTSTGG